MIQIKEYQQITRNISEIHQNQLSLYQRIVSKCNNRLYFLLLTVVIYITIGILALIPQQTYKVAIIGTNDLHGQAFPTIIERSDNKQKYAYGGLVYMSSMIKTIKEQYNQNVIYLDAGDQFQGGIQSSKLVSSGQIMNDFFNQVGLTFSTVGNHQFDFGPQFLINYLNGRKTPNLAANLKSDKGQDSFLPFQKTSQIFNLPNGIKIGVIGLATIETQITTAGFISHLFPTYKFLPYKQIVIKQSQKLKKNGANAVIIVSHVGDACISNFQYSIRDQQTQQPDCPPDQITKLINQLPQGTIDGIVQGHRHRIAHNYFKGVPYMGSILGGYYFNIMQLTFNSKKQLISSKIQGPIPVCQKIFSNRKRCDYAQPSQLQNVGNLINWQFHNKTVIADPQLSKIFETKYQQKMSIFEQQIVQNQIKLVRKQMQQSQLSNLFTNLMQQAAVQFQPNFSLINTGAFRSEWLPGIIKYKNYYNMFPFQNRLQVFEINGKDLIQSLKIVQKGRRWIQAWNLRMEVQINKTNRAKQLLNVRFMDGTQIELNKTYRGVTLSYILEGGDQFNKAINTYFRPRNIKSIGEFRETVKPILKNMQVIKKGSLIDPKNPRLVVHIKQ